MSKRFFPSRREQEGARLILTDREIRIALQEKTLVIDPIPDLTVALTSSAIDLTLSDLFREWIASDGVLVAPGRPGYSYAKLADKYQVGKQGPYILKPHCFVLAWTAEKVSIPYTSRLAARVEGKSNIARLGICIHVTAPIIHSGYIGHIQLEMFNFGPHEVYLDPGMRICQLVFEQTAGTPDRGYSGMFAGQVAH
jgi:dCTP deaminase